MLPSGEARLYDPIEVSENLVEWLSFFRGVVGQKTHDVARLDDGDDGQVLDLLHVVGHPINHLMSPAPEVLTRHVARRFITWRANRI